MSTLEEYPSVLAINVNPSRENSSVSLDVPHEGFSRTLRPSTLGSFEATIRFFQSMESLQSDNSLTTVNNLRKTSELDHAQVMGRIGALKVLLNGGSQNRIKVTTVNGDLNVLKVFEVNYTYDQPPAGTIVICQRMISKAEKETLGIRDSYEHVLGIMQEGGTIHRAALVLSPDFAVEEVYESE